MTLTIDFGFNIQLRRGQQCQNFALPLLRKQIAFTRQAGRRARPSPGRLATLVTVAGIITSSVVWGVLG